MSYYYGMKSRDFSTGYLPEKGLQERADDETGKYYDIIIYGRLLTNKELKKYDLEYIKEDNSEIIY